MVGFVGVGLLYPGRLQAIGKEGEGEPTPYKRTEGGVPTHRERGGYLRRCSVGSASSRILKSPRVFVVNLHAYLNHSRYLSALGNSLGILPYKFAA
jgi:hypothetical protein